VAAAIEIDASQRGVGVDLRELWRYREVVGFLALRDLKARYKQTALGAAWAVLQPFLTMVVFALLFGLLLGPGGRPSVEGVPYAVSTYCALVPWTLFARALTASGESLVQNQQLVTRVYVPRLVLPLAPILAALVDFALAFAVLLAMMLAHGIVPGWPLLLLPAFTLLAVVSALAVGLWLAALNALYRDVRHALPFLAQLWMLLTPVVYTAETLLREQPGWVVALYGMNPMAGVVEGFRWALVGGAAPPWGLLAVSCAATACVLAGGLVFFQRLERRLADCI
jgi:lipopolysaccharide transport system permease protein